ncbi:hypothetical protein SK128_014029 [Halocaridina rubra]|uniref:PPIase cyclophilin-type domain-containing protein n=1 Tax=Halocaridina rubra TaxID=373956 RepID=A0AAN8WXN5_HALRR
MELKPFPYVDTLLEMVDSQGQMIGQERIFAVKRHFGHTRYAKITSIGNRMYVHHLQDGQPPPDAQVLQYDDVLKRVDSSSRLTFLNLASMDTDIGQLIIRLSPDTPGARNFALLCSGEEGPTYAMTRLFQVYHRGKKWEYIGGGDYELNNGEGGRALVPGLLLGKEYERPWIEGTVRGFWGLGDNVGGQFFINTHSHATGVCSPAFGIVENGLEVLKQIVKYYQDISMVFVKDCGIVLSNVV